MLRLKEVHAIWEKLSDKDTGALGQADLQEAIESTVPVEQQAPTLTDTMVQPLNPQAQIQTTADALRAKLDRILEAIDRFVDTVNDIDKV